RNIGLEGQWFYTAHSRSTISGWTLATGVPVADVERELRGSTLAMIAGAGLTALLAVALAIVFGRRIARPVSALPGAAAALERGDRQRARRRSPRWPTSRAPSTTRRDACALVRPRCARARQSPRAWQPSAHTCWTTSGPRARRPRRRTA